MAGQEVILFRASSSDPAEDFVVKDLGKAGSLYTMTKHSLFTPQFKAKYGSLQAYRVPVRAARRQQPPLRRHLAG